MELSVYFLDVGMNRVGADKELLGYLDEVYYFEKKIVDPRSEGGKATSHRCRLRV